MASQMTIEIDRRTASRLLKVSVRTVDRYIRSGKLNAQQENGRIWLDRREVMNFSNGSTSVAIRTPQHISSQRHTLRNPKTATSNPVQPLPRDTLFYRDLYDEARKTLADYQQKLSQSNFRISQLETQILGTPPPTKQSHVEEHAVNSMSAATELFRRELADKEKELSLARRNLTNERNARIIFSIITYVLLGLQPIFWYFLR